MVSTLTVSGRVVSSILRGGAKAAVFRIISVMGPVRSRSLSLLASFLHQAGSVIQNKGIIKRLKTLNKIICVEKDRQQKILKEEKMLSEKQ